jgi:hypothetical protein
MQPRDGLVVTSGISMNTRMQRFVSTFALGTTCLSNLCWTWAGNREWLRNLSTFGHQAVNKLFTSNKKIVSTFGNRFFIKPPHVLPICFASAEKLPHHAPWMNGAIVYHVFAMNECIDSKNDIAPAADGANHGATLTSCPDLYFEILETAATENTFFKIIHCNMDDMSQRPPVVSRGRAVANWKRNNLRSYARASSSSMMTRTKIYLNEYI